jgi:cyclopropane-fatty-acyl-phospholipid synthase
MTDQITRPSVVNALSEPIRSEVLLEHAAPKQIASVLGRLAEQGTRVAGSRVHGSIEIGDARGSFRVGTGDTIARVEIRDRRAYAALVRSGSVGLGQAYVKGWWEADDLTGLIRWLFANTQWLRHRIDTLARSFAGALDLFARHAPEPAEDLRNVRAHYDLSNQFFAAMLDETMTYSCAMFEDANTSLHDAQIAKMDQLCKKLNLRPGERLIEIGTGWGALAIHAASHYGVEVTTTTISPEQQRLASTRVAEAGLTHRITVLGLDWRELEGTFDKLVSVEMIEAVDWRLHDQFLAKCASLLQDEGLAALQVIVIDDKSFERAKRHRDFIREMVFPGGCIPSITSLMTSVTRATDLRLIGLEDIGQHYAETLHRWTENISSSGIALKEGDPEFQRLWSLYLAYCEAAFLERHVSDVQLVLAKTKWRGQLGIDMSPTPRPFPAEGAFMPARH